MNKSSLKLQIKTKNPSNVLIGFLLISLHSILFLANEQGSLDILVALLVVVTDAIMVYKCRNNWFTLVISGVIAYYNYSICIAEYIFVFRNTYYTHYAGTKYATTGLFVLASFNLLLFIVMLRVSEYSEKHRMSCSVLEDNRNNKAIVYILIVVLILIWIFGYKRPSNVGERGTPSTYFEYSIILIILGFYYSGNDNLRIKAFTLISFAYVLLNFLYGGRATGAQVLLCLVLCVWANRISNKVLFVGGLALFFVMTMIGVMRASWTLNSESIKSVYTGIMDNKFTSNTAYSSYHTSLTFINYLELIDWRERMRLFGLFMLSLLVGGAVPRSNLPLITQQYFVHSYGGVFPFYMYFYLGYSGLLVIALYLFFVLKVTVKSSNRHNGLGRCVGVYIASTSLRWYVYSPSQITRGAMIMVICFYVLKFVDSIFERRHYHEYNSSSREV